LAEIASYDDAVAWLDDHIGAGVKPGLERITGLLELLARPDESYPIVHVAGTNGKTSTARMTAGLIGAHGLATGLFTSPHLQAVEERYEHGMRPMSREAFAVAVAELAPVVDLWSESSGDRITYFEITAALAFAWFAEKAVDAAVIEVGLGGRWDATNAATSEVAVVTSIGLEHTAYLGDTEALIAAEKAAILDRDAVLVTGELSDEALAVIRARAEEQGALWHRFGPDFGPDDARPAVGGWLFDVEGIHARYTGIDLRLHGAHQVHNFTVGVAATEALFGRALDLGAVREAAARAAAPGRMEIVRRDPLVMLDGAHNPPGMAALAEALGQEFTTSRWALVFGVMRDKDAASMLSHLDGLVTTAHVARAAGSDRALPAGEAAALVHGALDVETVEHPSVADAVAAAISSGDPVLVTGSLYVVGEARTALGV